MKLYILTNLIIILNLTSIVQFRLSDGIDAYNRKDYKQAALIFENILKQNPEQELVYQYLANSYLAMKNNTKAMDLMHKAIKYFPSNVEFHLLLGKLYAESNMLSEAESSLLTVLKISPVHREARKVLSLVYFNLGSESYKKKKLENAKNYYLKSIQYDSLNEDSYTNAAFIMLEQKKYLEAKKLAIDGIKIFPRNKNLLKILSEVYIQESDFTKAVEIYERLYLLDPGNIDIALNLALLYRYTNKVDAALSLYDTLMIQYPRMKKIYEAVIEYWKLFNAQDKIREVYQKMVRVFPDDIDLKFEIATTYLKENKYKEAREVYFEILKHDSINLKAYFEIAKSFEFEDKSDTALYYLDRALLIDNRDFDVLKMKADLLKKSKKTVEAIQVYRTQIKYYEELPFPYIQIGDIYFQMGEYDSAYLYYDVALKLDQKNPVLYYKIAKIKEKRNEGSNAEKYYRKALELGIKRFDLIQKSIESELSKEKLALDELEKLSPVKDEVSEINYLIDDIIKYLKNTYEYPEFKKFIDDYCSRYPMSITLLLHKSDNYQKEAMYDSALIILKKILSINPDQEEVHMKMGIIYEKLNEYEKAITSYLRLLKSPTKFNEAFDGLIRIYQQNDKLNELCDQMLELYKFNTGNNLLRERLIEILHKANRVSEARRIIEKNN